MLKKCPVRRAFNSWPKDRWLTEVAEYMDRVEPIEFPDAREPSKEKSELLVRESDVEELRETLRRNKVKDKLLPSWLQGLAEAMGYKTITDMPLRRMDEAKERLEKRAAAIRENSAPGNGAGSK